MSEKTSSSRSVGFGFSSALTLLFIGLKLTHYIDWSWWWVVSPLWIGGLFVVTILALVAFIAGCAAVVAKK